MTQFYDATNNQGLCQKVDFLCDTTDSSFPRIEKTREINNSLERVVGWIINADGRYQYDDTNYSNLPRGKGTLVEGQEDYSFSSEYLQLEAVDILDLNNYYRRIKPIDHRELGGMSPDEYFGLESDGSPKLGFPECYDKHGDTIRLYPAPTATYVTLANGLRLWFKRTASLFTVASDTSADTQEAGFASPYHEILAYMASIPYCMKYHPDRAVAYSNYVEQVKQQLIAHYGRREKDARKVATMAPIRFK